MIENDPSKNESFLANKHVICYREPPSSLESETKDAQDSSELQGDSLQNSFRRCTTVHLPQSYPSPVEISENIADDGFPLNRHQTQS